MTATLSSSNENSNPQLPSDGNQKIRALHVDDDEAFLEVSKQILESESNLQVDPALTVEEALGKLAKQQYDAIISDYEMPQKNGLEFLKKVREADKFIPFVLFTGKGREDVAIQALNMGASRYISKHGSPETVYGELTYAIRHACANAKAQAKLQTSERRFSILAAATFEGIAFSQHGKIVDSNPQLSKMFGYEPFELTKLSVMDLVASQSRGFTGRKIKEKNEGPYECLSLRKDNSVFPVEIRTKKIPYKEKTALMFSFLDISERKKAENELFASQELQTKLFMESSDAIFVANRENGMIVDCNPAALKLLGRGKGEVIGKSQAFLHPKENNNSPFTEGFKKHICEQGGVEETQIVTKNGKLKNVVISSSTFNLGNEKLIQGTFRESKDQNSAEKMHILKEFNDRIINSLDAALLVIDPRSYRIIDANTVAQKHAKLAKKKLIGKKCYEVTHQKTEPCQAPEHECPIRQFLKTGKSVTVEHTHIYKHNMQHVEVSAYPMIDPEGSPVIIHVEKDISERKRLEHALFLSEKNFRSVSNSLKDALILIDSGGNIEFWNPAAEKMFGYTSNEVLGKSFEQFIAPVHDRTSIKMGMKNFQETGQGAYLGKTLEITAIRKDGKEIPIELSISAFQMENDKKAVGVARDISERKMLEAKLQSEATIWKRTFDSISDCLFVFDKDLRIEKVNKAVLDATKKHPEDLIGKKCFQALHNTDSTLPGCPCGEVLTAKKTISTEMIDPTAEKCCLITASPILSDNDELIGVVHIHKDISDLKKQETQVRASQQKFAALFSSNPEAIVFVDVNFHVVDVNSSFSALFGYSSEEAKGKDIGDLVIPTHLKEEYSTICSKVRNGQVNGVSTRKKKDDSLVKVTYSGAPVVVNGKALGFVMSYKDISEISHVQEELAKALAQTKLLNEKLNTVGTFTRHDLKNKLSVLNARLYILRRHFSNNKEALSQVNELAALSQQMQRIMEFESAYVQIGMEKLQQIDVESCLKEAVSLHSELKEITVISECHGLKVKADSLLRQIFYNLIDDSVKYGKKVTEIKVSYENQPDGTVKLTYTDNGCGIDEEIKKKLFQKGAGKGTGLGLYLIKRICDYYGWSVQETSRGPGVRFEFKIPTTIS